MEFTFPGLSAEDADVLGLGVALGENHAFGLVAGRSAAAQAAALKRLREEKKYRRFTPHWNQFCPKFLNMSGSQADKIIRLFEEFGPGYFEVAQLTRVSADTYRAIEPSIKDGALHCQGEAIELEPENAQKVAQAVAELRAALPTAPPAAKKPARPLEMHERLAEVDQLCDAIIAEFQEISRKERNGENWLLFASTLSRVCTSLTRLKMENGVA
ncbi:MAG: hypothetical protein LAQ69_12660 [Acidobacteriia bacterium]|nr:hypothetical protein [Terriglobia bacterium]